jgi:hypothetical protein
MTCAQPPEPMAIQSASIERSMKGQTVASRGRHGVHFRCAAIQSSLQRKRTFPMTVYDWHLKQAGMPIRKQTEKDRVPHPCEEA